MDNEQFRIFVVDDDPVARMIAIDQLTDPHFRVREFGDAEGLLAALDEKPDLVLLDIEMPGMSGVAACRALRERDEHAQVLFVSANDDLETRLAAYNAGGSDFILKPYLPEELAEKVRVAETTLAQRHGLAEQARYAQTAAFSAMSSLGEMGVVIQFLRTSFAAQNEAQLADQLVEALGQYGLNGLVEIRSAAGTHCYANQRDCTPLEVSILAHTRGMDRIFQFRDRLAINYPRITLLVPDLPRDDPDRVGRLRDHLAIIAEGGEARLAALESDGQRLAQADAMVGAVAELTRALEEIEANQSRNRMRALQVSNDYLQHLEDAFVSLGLSGSQEDTLSGMAREATARISELLGEDKSLGDRLRQVAVRLGGIG
jgi:DNA-binding response OmpR family regulator